MLLIAFFACLYLHFHNRGNSVPTSDSIQIKQSSVKRLAVPPKAPLMENKTTFENTEKKTTDSLTDEDLARIESVESEDEVTALPWDDIDEGWKAQLKEYLVSADPERGEDMFHAYLEEKKKYVERVDFSDADNGVIEDLQDEEIIEHDSKEGELERLHVQNLKDIFGDLYPQVENLHREYVESIQYLNRSSAKFTVTL